MKGSPLHPLKGLLVGAQSELESVRVWALVLLVGAGCAVNTVPEGGILDPKSHWLGYVLLFLYATSHALIDSWRKARFARPGFKEAGEFMVAALEGPTAQELPFRALDRMAAIARAQRMAKKPSSDGSGERILANTRLRCARCARNLAAARPGPSSDLTPGWRCAACGSPTGRFAAWVEGPCPPEAELKWLPPAAPEPRGWRKARGILWTLLKAFCMAAIASCVFTDIREMAWVRGATGDPIPFILAEAAAALIAFWSYSVIWRPLRREGRP